MLALFKSFIYWLSQFGAEAGSRAGNNSGGETEAAGWCNRISAVREVQIRLHSPMIIKV